MWYRRIFVALCACALLTVTTGCASLVTRTELVARMNKRVQTSAYINILWYKGTKNDKHHLRHVYAMFGAKDYIATQSELQVPNPFPLTDDSQKWVQIRQIGDAWQATRRKTSGGPWEPRDEGMIVR
jgi:hypothetical protein